MSSIASFYFLPIDQRVVLSDPAAFDELMGTLPDEFESSDFSGAAVTSLDEILDDEGFSLFGDSSDEAQQLSEAGGRAVQVFDATAARALSERLNRVSLPRERVGKLFVGGQGDAAPETIDAVLAAFRDLKTCLGKVTATTLGVLTIG